MATVVSRRWSETGTAEELIEAYASDPSLRERVIEAWLPLAHHLARRYAGRGEPLDDLVQVATVGLIKAVDRYEPDRGVEFGYFAIPTVVGEIKRHFRDKTWAVRVPRRLQELRMEISAANDALHHSLGRPPTVTDVATHLGITEEEVLEGLEGARAYAADSLSAPVGEDGDTSLGDTLGGEDDGFAMVEFKATLGPAMAALDPRERRIVTLRFYGNQTQSEIAEQIGISQMHVSRLLARAMAKLRTHFGEAPVVATPRRRRAG
jgi:RNA polymerase sigma-B factor